MEDNDNQMISYSDAFNELTHIDEQLSKGDISLDELIPKLHRATYLIDICRKQLKMTEIEIEKIMNDFEGNTEK